MKLLLLTPCQLTTTGPDPPDPLGAFTTICVSLQLVIVPATPLKLTFPAVFCPKPVPVTVTCALGAPKVGLMPLTAGANCTLNVDAGEDPTEFVTITGSVPVGALAGTVNSMELAPQETRATACPLSVTDPADNPKFWPAIETVSPAATFCGLIVFIVGVKLKVTPLLCRFTTTGPDPAEPLGAVATTCVSLQLIMLPATPLKVTVPVVDPNPDPETVTRVPGGPETGESMVITGTA